MSDKDPMPSSSTDIHVHHVAGIDDRERGFNRQVQVLVGESSYQARLRYESLQIEIETGKTEEEALQHLIQGVTATRLRPITNPENF